MEDVAAHPLGVERAVVAVRLDLGGVEAQLEETLGARTWTAIQSLNGDLLDNAGEVEPPDEAIDVRFVTCRDRPRTVGRHRLRPSAARSSIASTAPQRGASWIG